MSFDLFIYLYKCCRYQDKEKFYYLEVPLCPLSQQPASHLWLQATTDLLSVTTVIRLDLSFPEFHVNKIVQ